MLIAECVLVYIEPNLSSALINWAGKSFSTALFVNYEPVSDLCRHVECLLTYGTADKEFGPWGN